MPFGSTLFIIYSCVSVTLTLVIAFLFWERRSATGAKTVAAMMALAFQWGLSDLLSALSSPRQLKIFWDNFAYVGISFIPVLWFLFSHQYARQEKYLSRSRILLLCIIPLLTLMTVFTSGFHHLFETRTDLVTIGLITVTDPHYGVWFWVHTIYSYVLILSGAFLLVRRFITLPGIYRQQSVMMILGVTAPFLGNILFMFGLPSHAIDTTVFSFTFTGIFFFLGMFKFKLFDLVPAARGAVVESMDELVIVLDSQNRIIDVNRAARKLFGKSKIDLIGKSVFPLMGRQTETLLKYRDVMEATDKVTLFTGAAQRVYDFRIASLSDNMSRSKGRFIIMRDITRLESMMEDLEKSRKAAEDATKAKSQFLATMSHEIRTPINGIIGMSELLGEAKLTSEEKEFLQSIQFSADSLLDIINDVLDFSKIEAGKMELENIQFDLNEQMENIIKSFIYKAQEKNLVLKYHIDAAIPGNLLGDPVRLRQIMINLISNALKFTNAGSIEIHIALLKSQNSQALLQFSVQDTGLGIPAEKIGHLFSSFQQVDNSTTRKYGGSGLGLAIVKNLVSMMGGNIEVDSAYGKGSRFSFILPFQIANVMNAPVSRQVAEEDFSGKNFRILVAEDNKVNQLLMLTLLQKKNFQVDIAENGILALDIAEQNHYDLILMDIQMPQMDGYEAAQAIRARETGTQKHIPIIALTANATEGDREQCFQSGMDDYLSKPVKSANLFSCIKKYLN